VPAVYGIFTDRAGLVCAMFFEGFRWLGAELAEVPETDDPIGGRCGGDRGVLSVLPGVSEAGAGDVHPAVRGLRAGRSRRECSVREVFIGRTRRCVNEGLLDGDPTDIAHVLLALAQGLAVQKADAGWGRLRRRSSGGGWWK
jgi:hypothetical protein